ncbi:4'-phosphopantetheinyl transferase superfamily protein [Micromonospora sp. NPDC051196]|uniref:4'-phosphopantetheinyl transferase family protein n=1 Tax=Micromonospora sp. NPDC051196 TaxID=3155281 RepID=UPI003448EDB1
MIERILPAGVAAVESFGDQAGIPLFAEEEAVVARAVDKRRREFAAVRHCARTALARLGYPPGPILPGTRGAPQWPAGVVGSMTHCDGYRAAALAHATDVLSVGIDAEPAAPLPPGVLSAVAMPSEREWIAKLGAERPGIPWDRLLFSAKETVYKTWFPLTGRWLDFAEAEIVVRPEEGAFAARLLVPGPLVDGRAINAFTGRFVVADGLVLTAIALVA